MISPRLENPSSLLDRDGATVDSANELVLEFCPELLVAEAMDLLAQKLVEDLTVHYCFA